MLKRPGLQGPWLGGQGSIIRSENGLTRSDDFLDCGGVQGCLKGLQGLLALVILSGRIGGFFYLQDNGANVLLKYGKIF